MSPALALAAWLIAGAEPPPELPPELPPLVEEPAPPVIADDPAAVDPPPWPGEERRFHWGAGARVHFGGMLQLGTPQLLAESGIFGLLSLRTVGHQEFRVQVELNLGIPDLFGGESQISWRWYLSPRFSVGGALLIYVGAPSLRLGAEIPVAFRFGKRRQHEIGASLRFTGGVFNNTTFVWFDFGRQRPAVTFELTAGYTYLF